MLHSEDSALGLVPTVSSERLAPPPELAHILRLPHELLLRCFEPLLGGQYCDEQRPLPHSITPSQRPKEDIQPSTPDVQLGSQVCYVLCHKNDKEQGPLAKQPHCLVHEPLLTTQERARRFALLWTCREFRTIGLDLYYSQNVFVFSTDAQLQKFIANTQPQDIARVQHVILEFEIGISYRIPYNYDIFILARNSGVYNYAALTNFPKLTTVHLEISTVLDPRISHIVPAYMTRGFGIAWMWRVLAIATWPRGLLSPTHSVEHRGEYGGKYSGACRALEFVDGRPRLGR